MSAIIDAYNDPYQELAICKARRAEFNKLKKSSSFVAWRARQKKIQENRCAYCKCNLLNKNIITHIDHVTPLRFSGKNTFDNFVLSCKRCNVRKWVATNYAYPEWIRKNDERMRKEQRLRSIQKSQDIQARELNDEIIMDSLSWI